MAAFMEDLWNSIFVPGPTPTLLVATNATFAALQLLLLVLLIATYSVHFVILSILSAGLWWSINWFAKELLQAQAEEEAQKTGQPGEDEGEIDKKPSAADGESDTETESAGESRSTVNIKRVPDTLHPHGGDDTLRKRRSLGDSSGYVSTDSEWEKVEDSEEKDR